MFFLAFWLLPVARLIALPAAEYARAKAVDYGRMAQAQRAFSDRYLKEVR